jgi:hypothetical protein
MKITNIEATGIKARTFKAALHPVTIIAGPNDSGKTAIADAVRLALLGYIPELGKTNAATFTLASGSEMTIAAQIDGKTIARKWRKAGDTVRATSEDGIGLAETPIAMMDASDYFGRSAAGQISLLFSLIQLDDSKFTREAICAELKQAEPNFSKEIDRICGGKGDSMEAWIVATMEKFAAESKSAKETAERFNGAAQGIIQLRQEKPIINAAEAMERDKKIREKIDQIGKEKAVCEAQGRAVMEIEQKRAKLAASMTAAAGKIRDGVRDSKIIAGELESAVAMEAGFAADLRTESARWDQYNQQQWQREKLAREIAQMTIPPESIGPDRLRELEAVITENAVKPNECAIAEQALNSERFNLDTKTIARINREAEISQHVDRYRAQSQADKCPTCGTCGDAWKTALFAKFESEQSELAKLLEKEEAAEKEAAEKHKAASVELAKIRDKMQTAQLARESLHRFEGEIATREVALAQRTAKQVELALLETGGGMNEPKKTAIHIQTEALIAKLRAELIEATESERAAEEMRSIDARIQELPPEDPNDPDARAYSLECEINELREDLAASAETLKLVSAQLAEEKTLIESREASDKATNEMKAMKALRDLLAKKREGMINESVGPILGTVNFFTRNIIPTALEYRDGEIGRFNGPSWVPVRAMGGTHQAAVYAGINAALGTKAPARIVIVDEMGRFDTANKRQFVRNIQHAIRNGLIDQFIGIDTAPAEWRMIQTGDPDTATETALAILETPL